MNIEIYTSNSCTYCRAAKEFFNDNEIDFLEHNISTNKAAKLDLMARGIMSVPAIVIDGQFYVGFDREKLEELLIE